jgi:hypothetical protein
VRILQSLRLLWCCLALSRYSIYLGNLPTT